MRRLALAIPWLTLACAQPSLLPAPPDTAPGLAAARIAEDVRWLADEAREGRGLGTAGLDTAARRLAAGFREAGFEPAARDGSYFQAFDTPVAIRIAEARLQIPGAPRVFEREADFEAFLASSDGDVTGGAVFAGYGISAPELGYDDYAGLDVRGRVVLVLDYRPENGASRLAGAKGARYLSRGYKLANARRQGAAAVLLAPSARGLEGLPGAAGAEEANPTLQSSGIPALALSRRAAERLVDAAPGESLAERQAVIDATGTPRSATLPGLRVRVAVRVERRWGRVANVVALRRGSDPQRAREAVVIGAHYDHLGRGEFGSLSPDRKNAVHPGADDNASGAAGLLALARAFGSAPPAPRTLVLAAFTGEEAGLVGSAHYVSAPPVPLADTIAMLNLDMIGRLRERKLTVFGAETSPTFRKLVARSARGLALELDFAEGAFGPSDQTSFYARNVPVLFFFTGTHPQYHTPGDVAALVDAEGMATILTLTQRAADALLRASTRPALVEAAAPPRDAAGRSYGPYLGSVPVFGGPPVRGVRLQGVRAGSPAQVAGLRAGDVIVEFDGASVANLEEFSALLSVSRPGQRVEIVVERDGAAVRVTATLGQRR